jgi:hypothetical protein
MLHPGLSQNTVQRNYFPVRDNQDSAHEAEGGVYLARLLYSLIEDVLIGEMRLEL